MLSAMPELDATDLGAVLRARRREKHLSLRDLHELTGVSVNTLSRVERGHVPDLKNFRRIVDWLDEPAERFLEPRATSSTPAVIARHLRADHRLSDEAAMQLATVVEDMYRELVGQRPALSMHLRSAKTFTPGAGTLLAEILGEMQSNLEASLRE
jgi:transcriptional regulator with XRE-family HTH domain